MLNIFRMQLYEQTNFPSKQSAIKAVLKIVYKLTKRSFQCDLHEDGRKTATCSKLTPNVKMCSVHATL